MTLTAIWGERIFSWAGKVKIKCHNDRRKVFKRWGKGVEKRQDQPRAKAANDLSWKDTQTCTENSKMRTNLTRLTESAGKREKEQDKYSLSN